MSWKTIVTVVVILVVLSLGGIFYYAYHKINGEELRGFMISSLERAFPYANVNVGEVGIQFGKSLNLTVQGFSLDLAGKKTNFSKELFKIEKVGINIPLWVLLGFEQNIIINMEGAWINFVQSGKSSNWLEAYKKRSENRTESEPTNSTAMAPAFLTNGKINLKLTDTRLNYRFDKKQEGEILIKYFRVNNLGVKGNAAYELKSDISLKFSKQNIDTELSLIGQFSPKEFLEQGTLRSTSILTVNKMYFTNQGVSVPGFKTDIKFDLSNIGDVTVKLATVLNEKNHIYALVKTRNKELSIENIDVALYLDELLDILKIDIPSLKTGEGKIEIKGSFLLGAQFQPNVVFSIGPQIKYSYNDILFSGDLKGKYQDKNLVMGITAKGLNGSLYGDLSIDIDIGKEPLVLSQLPPFKFSIMANDLVLPTDMVQNTFYASSQEKNVMEEKKILLLPRGTMIFNFKNISLGGEPVSLAGTMLVSNRKLESNNIKITTSEGEGSISFESLLYREGSKNKFSVNSNNLDLKNFNVLLPKKIGTWEGVSSGKIEGELDDLNGNLSYNTHLDFKIKKGRWHGVDITRYFQEIFNDLSNIPALRHRLQGKKIRFSNSFQEFFLKGVLSNVRWDLERYYLIEKELSFKGRKSTIYLPPTNKKSVLMIDVDLKSLRSAISKNFRRKNLPLRLIGTGFTLKPDISFTSNKLVKNHVEKRTEKLIQGLKGKILKKSPEKEKIKDLLKGVL